MIISYAQRLEDVFLWRALQGIKSGFYIDLGANDPTVDSVTKLFYDKGWSGINVEPSPTWFTKLVGERIRDINLNIAVSDKPGLISFHDIAGTGLSTSSEYYAEKHAAKGFGKTTFTVDADTLANICDRYVTGPIHFLKIDIEGAEEAALRGANLQRFRPWIILIEATEPGTNIPSYETWESIIIENNYTFAIFDGLNRYYVANERAELLPVLSTPVDDYTRNTLLGEMDRLRADLALSESAARNARSAPVDTKLTRYEAEVYVSEPGLNPPRFRVIDASYFAFGPICFIRCYLEVDNNNSGNGGVIFSLPRTAAATFSLSSISGRENGLTGKSLTGTVVGNTKTLALTFYDGSFPAATEGAALSFSGWYEVG